MQQSRVDQSGLHHTDGWGIVVYQDDVPVLQKKATPAFDDTLFSFTAESSYSTTILAHVRQATVGGQSVANTHPFVHENWSFAHNGTLVGFDAIGPQIESETDGDLQRHRHGQTDSEQYFLWLLTRLRANNLLQNPHAVTAADAWIDCLLSSVSLLAERCQNAAPEKIPRLNFVLTNGRNLFACRWNHTLYWIARRGIYDCEICGIPHIHHDTTVTHRAVAVASEPVTSEKWTEVPNHSLVHISPKFDLQIRTMKGVAQDEGCEARGQAP